VALTNLTKHYYLQQMGIQTWVPRTILPICTRCDKHRNLSKQGNPGTSLMIICDAFQKNALDEQGTMLNRMLTSIGLGEQDVYITYLQTNQPELEQGDVGLCSQCLSHQIDVTHPNMLLALGVTAGELLTQSNLPFDDLRNKQYDFKTIPCWVTYHPAHLLRCPSDKKKAWQDLLKIKAMLARS
jgi:DNA polymerase